MTINNLTVTKQIAQTNKLKCYVSSSSAFNGQRSLKISLKNNIGRRRCDCLYATQSSLRIDCHTAFLTVSANHQLYRPNLVPQFHLFPLAETTVMAAATQSNDVRHYVICIEKLEDRFIFNTVKKPKAIC